MRRERIGIVFFIFILFFVLLQIRIIVISLFPDPRLKSISFPETIRGSIFDRNQKELAISSTFYSFYIRPKSISEDMKKAYYSLLSQRHFQTNELSGIFSDRNFIWIRRKMSLTEIEPVKDMISVLKKSNIILKDELGIIPEQGRFYTSSAAAHTVGIVGMDNKGLTGLELSMNTYLEQGNSIYTTLDRDLSLIAYEELKKGIIENQAEYGSVVIMDNASREILAFVDFPTFDPNDLKSMSVYNMRLRATSSIFEPGSVMKQFSAAFALEKKYNSPFYPVYDCSGTASVQDHDFTCSEPHGQVDLSTIIQKSCNVGMVQVADRFKKNEYYQFLKEFGFGDPVSLPLNENSSGILRNTGKWSILSKYMISIGQEIGVTAVQLAAASSVIASDGNYKTPVLISSIIDEKGRNVYKPGYKEYPVISPENSRALLKMMEKVVSENGTAISAKIEGITIAGKTGTGQIAKESGNGYYKDLFNAVFVGYVPSSAPKYTFVVIIHKPHGIKHTGGLVAAPVFANIIRRMIASTPYFSGD